MTIAMDLSYWPDPGVWEFLLNLVLLSFTSSETTARLGKNILQLLTMSIFCEL